MTDALTFLTNIFFMISTALLIPVMLGLLLGLLLACVIFGRMIRELTERLGFAKERRMFAEKVELSERTFLPLSANGDVLAVSVNRILSGHKTALHVDYIVSQAEACWQMRLEKLQTWTRLGPSLGLMGTLIPLGPGLLALANGDLAQLSANLIIAFATTVVGILIAVICSGVHALRKRWYRDDALLLNFFAESVLETGKEECTK